MMNARMVYNMFLTHVGESFGISFKLSYSKPLATNLAFGLQYHLCLLLGNKPSKLTYGFVCKTIQFHRHCFLSNKSVLFAYTLESVAQNEEPLQNFTTTIKSTQKLNQSHPRCSPPNTIGFLITQVQ